MCDQIPEIASTMSAHMRAHLHPRASAFAAAGSRLDTSTADTDAVPGGNESHHAADDNGDEAMLQRASQTEALQAVNYLLRRKLQELQSVNDQNTSVAHTNLSTLQSELQRAHQMLASLTQRNEELARERKEIVIMAEQKTTEMSQTRSLLESKVLDQITDATAREMLQSGLREAEAARDQLAATLRHVTDEHVTERRQLERSIRTLQSELAQRIYHIIEAQHEALPPPLEVQRILESDTYAEWAARRVHQTLRPYFTAWLRLRRAVHRGRAVRGHRRLLMVKR